MKADALDDVVLDSSVVFAILLGEPDAHLYSLRLAGSTKRFMSTVTRLEISLVALSRGSDGLARAQDMLDRIQPQLVAFDAQQAIAAERASLTYGKGRHPARLNFGDCCAYALAKSLNLPLLYKGHDFAQTDITSALA